MYCNKDLCCDNDEIEEKEEKKKTIKTGAKYKKKKHCCGIFVMKVKKTPKSTYQNTAISMQSRSIFSPKNKKSEKQNTHICRPTTC